MLIVGAPDDVWLQCDQYVAAVHNICAHERLNWQTPHESRHGDTPDISPWLLFSFYEPIYYLDSEIKHPRTQEREGFWLGVSENIGDLITFKILTKHSHRIIFRSVVRSAVRTEHPNAKLRFEPRFFRPDLEGKAPDPAQFSSGPLPTTRGWSC